MAKTKPERKLEKLETILKKMGKIVIAFSGGVDSTFLAFVAHKVLGKGNVIAVTAVSETYSKRELSEARSFAKFLDVRHMVIHTEELADQRFQQNSPLRCYYCKRELFSKLKTIGRIHRFSHVVDAANIDDLGDYRPGLKAANELNVRHPLQEADLTKKEIRALSRRFELATWNKPALACLASRVPYGTGITKKILTRVNKAEDFLRSLVNGQLRVRDYGTTARIEIDGEKKIAYVLKKRKEIVKFFKRLGYGYVTVDLEGYRTGSMNEVLKSCTLKEFKKNN